MAAHLEDAQRLSNAPYELGWLIRLPGRLKPGKLLNYFRAQKMISSGVVKGWNNQAKVILRKSYGFGTCRVLDPYINRLASCRSRNAPAISSDGPLFFRASPASA